jgi:hypothetical protein
LAGHTDVIDCTEQKILAEYDWQMDEDIIQINK